MSIKLGCIADDFTGASDLGAMLSRAGMRVLLVFGLHDHAVVTEDCDAVIIALKSRSLPACEAVEQSLAALEKLRQLGAERFFFKYCSTFDSTDEGNIGPVADALANELNAHRVLFCPAFPENGRTVYNGHLFVHGELLNESGMENHPLNPMTDANLQRVLNRQTERSVGVLPFDAVNAGSDGINAALHQLLQQSAEFVIADALNNHHLAAVAAVVRNDILVTGGSAIGQALAGVLMPEKTAADISNANADFPAGKTAVIAGSCSLATQQQVAKMQTVAPSLHVDPMKLASGTQTVESIIRWSSEQSPTEPFLIYSTADAQQVAAAQHELGQQVACSLLEDTLGQVAAGLVAKGICRLVVAGGETSGAVMREIGCAAVWIGPEIAPGVPWVLTCSEPRIALALKSGNFGAESFFLDAIEGPA